MKKILTLRYNNYIVNKEQVFTALDHAKCCAATFCYDECYIQFTSKKGNTYQLQWNFTTTIDENVEIVWSGLSEQ